MNRKGGKEVERKNFHVFVFFSLFSASLLLFFFLFSAPLFLFFFSCYCSYSSSSSFPTALSSTIPSLNHLQQSITFGYFQLYPRICEEDLL